MGAYFNLAGRVNLGDIAAARYLQAEAWTQVVFFRPQAIQSGNEMNILGRPHGGSATRQLRVEIDNGTTPQNLSVEVQGNKISASDNVIHAGIWYFLAITCSGAAATNDMASHLYDLSDGSIPSGYPFTGTHAGDIGSNTRNIEFGVRNSTVDPFQGDIAHGAYIQGELSVPEIEAIMTDPYKYIPVMKARHGVVFWEVLNGDATEQDWSGNQNDGTATGTAAGANPPTLPVMGYVAYLEEETAGGAFTLDMGQGSYALTGQDVGLLAARTLGIEQGSYALSGQAVGLAAARRLTIGQGSYALSGQDIALKHGFTLVMGQGSYGLTGQDIGLLVARILTVDHGSYSLAGQAVELFAGRTLAIGQGSYTLTGQDIIFIYSPVGNFTLVMGQGSYALNGQGVGLLVARTLDIGQGSYSLSGQDVELLAARTLDINQGSYALSGQAVELLAARTLDIGQGSYTLTGQDIIFIYSPVGNFTLVMGQGSYALTGQAVGLAADRTLGIGQGSYALSGQAVGLNHGFALAMGQGSYVLTGQEAGLLAARALGIGQGSYVLTGQAVILTFSGLLVQTYLVSIWVNPLPSWNKGVNPSPTVELDSNPLPNKEVLIK